MTGREVVRGDGNTPVPQVPLSQEIRPNPFEHIGEILKENLDFQVRCCNLTLAQVADALAELPDPEFKETILKRDFDSISTLQHSRLALIDREAAEDLYDRMAEKARKDRKSGQSYLDGIGGSRPTPMQAQRLLAIRDDIVESWCSLNGSERLLAEIAAIEFTRYIEFVKREEIFMNTELLEVRPSEIGVPKGVLLPRVADLVAIDHSGRAAERHSRGFRAAVRDLVEFRRKRGGFLQVGIVNLAQSQFESTPQLPSEH